MVLHFKHKVTFQHIDELFQELMLPSWTPQADRTLRQQACKDYSFSSHSGHFVPHTASCKIISQEGEVDNEVLLLLNRSLNSSGLTL